MSDPKLHAELSASGAERWMACPGSVALIRKAPPQKDNVWGIEGTLAHTVMEAILVGKPVPKGITKDMLDHALKMVKLVRESKAGKKYATLHVEKKVQLPESIGPNMFGTVDSAVVDPFGELHILDFKYGTSPVDTEENMQLTYYAIGFAHLHHYEFESVKFTICQPRSRAGYNPYPWVTTPKFLKIAAKLFAEGVKRTKYKNAPLAEGKWCYWCPAKEMCPLKKDKQLDKARSYFE